MERPITNKISSPSGHTHTPSSSITGRISREVTWNVTPHQHQQVPTRSARQTRNPIHRESQHYPMAERCMCSSCHLSAKLFPRTGDGRIVLPIVPVTRTQTAHAHNGSHGAEGGDLTQYMLAPSDTPGGLGRSSSSSTANDVSASAPLYPSEVNPTANLHGRAHMVQSHCSASLYHDYHHHADLTSSTRPPVLDPCERDSERDDRLDNDGDTEMKVPPPTSLTGPGVAGSRNVSRSNPLSSPNHSSHSSEHNSLRQPDHDCEYETAKLSSRPPSGSYTGPLLPPHPPVTLQLSPMVMNPTAKRGRPKGKGKSKTGTSTADNLSDGASSTRNSPNLPLLGPNHSQPLQHPASHPSALLQSANGPSNPAISAVQQDLAPCKPRRGRPPRHEVVPGMGEFTVFL
ncbi:hypothetical protein AGABI1DRAFT_131249 [Agaricus bisporus var. burnettii JB137-S8]|uniref:Uncharacterized protein n=1 Tax=Agaricus bisporus var. burnettii (strain JB137-S8 / ATCC MYA-4627 / FGSC 10392) TaxID=597362 RepID=K5WM74_AGABU|nr:uncharacterized protein AGABI1DRAFT_131249 [Agaricus bisporus var. burnettii JB137-S8]EKM76421.1 hypothetical protein AGABI1DRAFT_131249 [Agaricus bisporus var. burnettii JB137-S8]